MHGDDVLSPASFGGDAIHVYRLSNELARRGHRVTAVHSLDAYRFSPERSCRGVSERTGSDGADDRPGLYASTLKKVFEEDFDVIHFQTPIARLPAVEPVIVRSNGVALVRDARNHAAAVLYLEWLVSAGEKVAFDLGRDPARRDLATQDTFKTVPVDYSKLVKHQDEWMKQYERFLSKGKEVHAGG